MNFKVLGALALTIVLSACGAGEAVNNTTPTAAVDNTTTSTDTSTSSIVVQSIPVPVGATTKDTIPAHWAVYNRTLEGYGTDIYGDVVRVAIDSGTSNKPITYMYEDASSADLAVLYDRLSTQSTNPTNRKRTVANPWYEYKTVVVDVNQDGLDDVVVALNNKSEQIAEQIKVYIQQRITDTDGAGRYVLVDAVKAGINISGLPYTIDVVDIIVNDFNNDGLPDLYFANGVGTALDDSGNSFQVNDFVLINNGDSVQKVDVEVNSTMYPSYDPVLYDVNNDGQLDIVVQRGPNGRAALVNDGTGKLVETTNALVLPTITLADGSVVTTSPQRIIFEDLNEDGLTDIVSVMDIDFKSRIWVASTNGYSEYQLPDLPQEAMLVSAVVDAHVVNKWMVEFTERSPGVYSAAYTKAKSIVVWARNESPYGVQSTVPYYYNRVSSPDIAFALQPQMIANVDNIRDVDADSLPFGNQFAGLGNIVNDSENITDVDSLIGQNASACNAAGFVTIVGDADDAYIRVTCSDVKDGNPAFTIGYDTTYTSYDVYDPRFPVNASGTVQIDLGGNGLLDSVTIGEVVYHMYSKGYVRATIVI